jgi:hypothetical protein
MIIHHTETPTSSSRIKERLFDRKITALSINFIIGLKDLGYMEVLFKDNKSTIISASSLFLAFLFLFSWPGVSIIILFSCYAFISFSFRSFRIGLNYLIYGVGLLYGILSNTLTCIISRGLRRE